MKGKKTKFYRIKLLNLNIFELIKKIELISYIKTVKYLSKPCNYTAAVIISEPFMKVDEGRGGFDIKSFHKIDKIDFFILYFLDL